jgi:hypothetical protein
MSEFKGTKTKWNKMDASRFGIPFIIYNEKEETIFQCYGEDAKANALLISKAPELLEMLNKLAPTLERYGEIEQHKEVIELIKEATEL